MSKDTIPCKDCICLAICCQTPKIKAVGPLITNMGIKCSIIDDYLRLKDLNLKMPEPDVPMKDRLYYNKPLSKRIIALFCFMKWTEIYDLADWYDIAYGEGS